MHRKFVSLLAAFITFALSAGVCSSAPTTTELLRLVPAETSLCFVLQDLRDHSRRLADSPFAAWLATSTFGKSVFAGDEYRKLMVASKALSEQLGVSVDDLRDDVFGDAVVLAYQPAPPGKPELESGLLLLRARDPKKLASLLTRLNEIQTASGEVESIVEKSHQKRSYFERKKKAGKSEFYRIADGLFLASSQEHALHKAIEREVDPPKDAADSPFAAALDRLGLSNAAAALLFNPRTMDAEWTTSIRTTDDPRAKAILTQLGSLWTATDAIGLSLHLGKDAELSLGVSMNEKLVPEKIRPLLGAAEPSAVWGAIPQDALFAVAGRLDLPNLIAATQTFLPADARASLQTLLDQTIAPIVGKDQLPNLLRNIGPDWGFWVTAPEKADRTSLPSLTFALRVRAAGNADEKLAKAARGALDFFFQTFRVEYNRTHDDQYTIGEATAGKDTIAYLSNEKALPAGVRPAFAIRGDFLVVASTVEAVQRFAPPTAVPKDATGLVLRASVSKFAEYLAEYKKPLSEVIASWSNRKAGEVVAEFTSASTLLELARSIDIRRTDEKSHIRITLRIQFAKPLTSK